MFLGDRTAELVFRATNREITAIVTLSLPGIDPKADPNNFGVIIKGKNLHTPKADASVVFSHAANVWKYDDRCVAAIEKDPAFFKEISDELKARTAKLNTGELNNLNSFEQAAVFESEDLVTQGTGIPSILRIDFDESVEKAVLAVSALPFEKLRNYIFHLIEKSSETNGSLHDVTITHSSSVSAMDYYKMATRTFHPGRRFSDGDYMLRKAERALIDMGVPAGNSPPKPRYH